MADSRAGAPLRPGPRALLLALAWAVLVAGSPGALLPAGHPLAAVLFAALWSRAALRPGRAAWAVEWAVAAVGFGTLMWWLAYISWAVVPPTGIGMGAYAMVAGLAARRARRVLPAPLAATLAWVALETLRDLVLPPFGMGWLRLGHLAADTGWLAESARFWGVAGVSFVLTAVGAGLAHAPRTRSAWRGPGLVGPAWAAGSLILGAGLAAVGAPRTEPGPTLLLVQPNIAQDRKVRGAPWQEIVATQAELTLDGIAAARAAGEPIDLVCWSETMLRVDLAGPDLQAAVEAGAAFDPWFPVAMEAATYVGLLEENETFLVREELLGLGSFQGVLPPETAFLAGAEELRAVGGRIRRHNVAALWSAEGERNTLGKRHLVPLGETMYGLERFELGRRVVGGYVADLHAGPVGPALAFEDRDGRVWRFGAPICFDNAFVDAFRADVDFNVVLSNEAWYRDSWEHDQMVAFTRLGAIASGRAVARCTNSGLGFACDARGRELARLVVDGRDREVEGALRVTLPVPSDPASAPPFARFGQWVRWAFVALGVAAAVGGGRAASGRRLDA